MKSFSEGDITKIYNENKNKLIENNFNNLHQLVDNNIGDVKKSFDVKVNELNANLSKHTHNPVDDAMGNAESFIEMVKQNNIKL